MGLLCKLLKDKILETEMFVLPTATIIIKLTGTDICTDINLIDREDWKDYNGELFQYVECSSMEIYHDVCAEFVGIRKETSKRLKAARENDRHVVIVGAPELLNPFQLDYDSFMAKYGKENYINSKIQQFKESIAAFREPTTTSTINQNAHKYYNNRTPIDGGVPFDAEDLETFQSTAEIIMGKQGKSFCFHAVSMGYKVYIPVDTSVTLPIGARIPLTKLCLQTLRKQGCEDTHCVKVVPDDNVQYNILESESKERNQRVDSTEESTSKNEEVVDKHYFDTENDKDKFTPDPKQLEVINIIEGEHLVLAPPGCGKTSILAERVIRARQNGIPFNEMLCLTFTNRAARGMTDKIRKVIKEPSQELFIGNIHHFCSEFLFEYNLIPSNTSIIDEIDVEEIIAEIKKETVQDLLASKAVNAQDIIPFIRSIKIWDVYKVQHLLYQKTFKHPTESIFIQEPIPSIIKDFKNIHELFPGFSNVIEVFTFIESICKALKLSYGAQKLAATLLLASAYKTYKDNNLLLDFDDVLLLSYSHMLGIEKEDKIDYKRYSWIQVGEVQDLTPLQFAIVDLIATKNANILFLGDQQQAIFSFMGAKLSSLKTLCDRCKDNLHPLTFNYRSPKYLLDIFNKFAIDILKLPAEYLPETNDDKLPDESSKVILSTPSNQSMDYFVELISDFKAEYKDLIEANDNKEKPSIAILVNTNNAADEISAALETKRISHFKISGADLFSTPQIKFLKSHFRLMSFSESFMDWSAIYHAFNILGSVGRSRSFLRKLRDNAISPYDLMRDDNSTYILDFIKAYENQTLVVFDTETTGLNVFEDDIVQIAARKVRNGKTIDKFNTFIKTERKIPEMLGDRVNPLVAAYSDQLEKGTLLSHDEALNKFMEFSKGCTLIGHNIEYDYRILYYNLKKYCSEVAAKELVEYYKIYFDTLNLARLINPRLKVFKLEKLIESLGLTEALSSYDDENKGTQTYHLADEDVLATVSLLNNCFEKGSDYAKLQQDFIASDNYAKVKGELLRYRPFFRHTREVLYSDPSNEVPALVAEMRYVYEGLCKENILTPLDKIEFVFDFLTNEIIDPVVEPHLIQQLDNHMSKIISIKEADLCGSKSIKERVFICTIHKAKGLEFTHVIVADASENEFPRYYSNTPEQQKEDARLLYVAISRAKEKLTLIHPRTHYVWSEKYGKRFSFHKKLSIFLNTVSPMFNHKYV